MTDLGTCRDCGKSIKWATTSNNGRVPLDPVPCELGSVALDQYGCTGPLHADGVPDLTRGYIPHRVACNVGGE